LAQHREAVRQVAMADRLLITKCDLVDVAARDELAGQLAALNPGAVRIDVFRGEVAPDAVSGCGLYDPAGKLPDVAAWLGEEAVRAKPVANAWRKPGGSRTEPSGAPRHAGDVSSFVLCFEQPLDWLGFSDGLGLLLQAYGARILRIKGLLNVEGDPQPRVVQCVQHVAYPPASLNDWPNTPPSNDRKSRLVFIVRGLDAAEVAAMLGGFCGQIPQVLGAPAPD
jgi:G3E family GTPase